MRPRLAERKGDAKLRTAGAGLDVDLPLEPEDDAPGDVETEARSFAHLLRGKERVEHALLDLERNARTVVDHTHHDCGVVVSGRDRHRTGLWRRVERVLNQV